MGLGSERDLVPLGAGFDIVKRGYSRTQVEEHLERLDSDLRLIAADRDAAMSQAADIARQMERARNEIEELRGQVNRLSLPPTTLEGLSERLQRMLKLAQEEASDTKARAETDAVQIRARAEVEGAALRNRYEKLIAEVDGRRVELETEHRELVEKAQAEFAAKYKAADDERVRADADAEARRNQIDEDFEIAMAARRTDAMKKLATQEATSKAEAQRRVHEAADEAARLRAQVNEESTTLRAQVAEEQRASKAEVEQRLRESAAAAEQRLRESTAAAEQRLRESTEEAARIRAMVVEEQRASKAEAERRVREATEEANRRRHDALTEAQARVQDAHDEANRRVREATDEATRRMNHAAGRVEALRVLRAQIAEQLRSAHVLITNAAPALEPLPEEQEAVQTGLVAEQPGRAVPNGGWPTSQRQSGAPAQARPGTQSWQPAGFSASLITQQTQAAGQPAQTKAPATAAQSQVTAKERGGASSQVTIPLSPAGPAPAQSEAAAQSPTDTESTPAGQPGPAKDSAPASAKDSAPASDADAARPAGPAKTGVGQATTTQAIANAPTRRTPQVTQPKSGQQPQSGQQPAANRPSPAAQPAVPNRTGQGVRREPSTKR